MGRAIRAELAKLKRSRAPLWTATVALGWPFMSMETVYVFDNGTEGVNWGFFMGANAQAMASWYGLVLFGFIFAFVFGREYSERTVDTAFTLPIRRSDIVVSKLAVALGWVFGLTVTSVAARTVYAAVLGLEGFGWQHVTASLVDSLTVALLISFTLPIVALLAVWSRGYLAPMIYSAVMLLAGMAFLQVGWEQWVPWSMPYVVGGSSMFPIEAADSLVAGSWVVSAGVFAAGVLALIVYVNRAEVCA